jgi:hypothetical protein
MSGSGNIDLIDELVAPNYLNRGMGSVGPASVNATLSGMQAANNGGTEDLVAERDAIDPARYGTSAGRPLGPPPHVIDAEGTA